MAGDLGVVSPAMRAYAQRAGAAGGKISGIDLASGFGKIGSALPGGTAGAAASGCSLTQEVPAWGKAIAAQGAKVGAADDSYSANELDSSDRFKGVHVEGSARADGGR